jgi:hypothetical protein
MLYSHVWTCRSRQLAVFVFALFVVAPPLEARPKTDIVHLKNGDRLTGEIKGLARGKLTLLTDAVGTVAVEWSEIDRVKSEFLFEVETEAGGRFFGLIQPSSDQGKMDVEELAGTTTLEQARVVEITPIEETFW